MSNGQLGRGQRPNNYDAAAAQARAHIMSDKHRKKVWDLKDSASVWRFALGGSIYVVDLCNGEQRFDLGNRYDRHILSRCMKHQVNERKEVVVLSGLGGATWFPAIWADGHGEGVFTCICDGHFLHSRRICCH